MKYLILFFCLTGLTFSQELQQAKDALAEVTILWNEQVKVNGNLIEVMNVFALELQAIENPGEELIAVMKKYNIYKEPVEKNKVNDGKNRIPKK